MDRKRFGSRLLSELRVRRSLNDTLFRHLCRSLLPPNLQARHNADDPIVDMAEDKDAADGRLLELYTGILLRCEGHVVSCVGGAKNDGGVDVMVESTAADSDSAVASQSGRVLVQCKQYSNTPVNVDVLVQLLGAMDIHDVQHGLLVTSSEVTDGVNKLERHLSQRYEQWRSGRCQSCGDARRPMRAQVWDRTRLIALLDKHAAAFIEMREDIIQQLLSDKQLMLIVRCRRGTDYCVRHAICDPSTFPHSECTFGCRPSFTHLGGAAPAVTATAKVTHRARGGPRSMRKKNVFHFSPRARPSHSASRQSMTPPTGTKSTPSPFATPTPLPTLPKRDVSSGQPCGLTPSERLTAMPLTPQPTSTVSSSADLSESTEQLILSDCEKGERVIRAEEATRLVLNADSDSDEEHKDEDGPDGYHTASEADSAEDAEGEDERLHQAEPRTIPVSFAGDHHTYSRCTGNHDRSTVTRLSNGDELRSPLDRSNSGTPHSPLLQIVPDSTAASPTSSQQPLELSNAKQSSIPRNETSRYMPSSQPASGETELDACALAAQSGDRLITPAVPLQSPEAALSIGEGEKEGLSIVGESAEHKETPLESLSDDDAHFADAFFHSADRPVPDAVVSSTQSSGCSTLSLPSPPSRTPRRRRHTPAPGTVAIHAVMTGEQEQRIAERISDERSMDMTEIDCMLQLILTRPAPHHHIHPPATNTAEASNAQPQPQQQSRKAVREPTREVVHVGGYGQGLEKELEIAATTASEEQEEMDGLSSDEEAESAHHWPSPLPTTLPTVQSGPTLLPTPLRPSAMQSSRPRLPPGSRHIQMRPRRTPKMSRPSAQPSRDDKVWYTDREVRELILLYRKYGGDARRFANILDDPTCHYLHVDKAGGRDNVALKDKWRNLTTLSDTKCDVLTVMCNRIEREARQQRVQKGVKEGKLAAKRVVGERSVRRQS